MTRSLLRPLPVLLVLFLLASRGAAGGIDFDGLTQVFQRQPEAELTGDDLRADEVWKVKGFDPVKDVPAMENWVPQANVEGAAHCFAISLLTTFFHRRIEFVETPGESLDKSWSYRDLGKKVVKPDGIGCQLVFEFLGTHPDGFRVKVGGHSGLRAFTSPGAAGEELFQRNAEAIQFLLQIPTMGAPYARDVVFSSVDLIQKERFTREGLNRRAFQRLRERMQEGALTPFTMHPSTARTDGHVIVGYEIRQQGTKADLYCYDSNYPPTDSGARPTVVHFDLDAGNFYVTNSRGNKVYTDYDVISTIDPGNFVIRQMTRDMTRDLDNFLWLTDKFYAVLERAQGEEREERWKSWKEEFLPAWKANKELYKDSTSRSLRWSLYLPR